MLRSLDRRRLLEMSPLAAALVLTVVAYWPALTAPLFADDYVYIQSVRTHSFWHYLRVVVDPKPHKDVLVLTQNYWRPLAYLSWQPMDRLFGGHLVLFHLVNLVSHLAATVLLWLITRRLTGRWLAAAVAAFVFALHPAGYEAVAWISSVNYLGLPLALGGWLLFLRALDAPPGQRRRRHAAAVILFAAALGFRETSAVVLAAMAIWFVLVQARPRWRDWRAYLPLAPYVALALGYLLADTRFLTLSLSKNEYAYHWGGHMPKNALKLLNFSFSSFTNSTTRRHDLLAGAGTTAFLAVLPIGLVLRRWTLVAAFLAFVVSVIPTSAVTFGLGARYFYLSSALFALAAGVAAGEAAELLRRRVSARQLLAVMLAAGAGATLLFAVCLRWNVDDWTSGNPEANQDWVEQLNARVGAIPAGGTLYIANPPPILALFEGYNLEPTVRYYQPQVGKVILVQQADIATAKSTLRGDDRLFIYEPRPGY